MEESSSGPDLLEEVSTLKQVIDFIHAEGYEHITIIAKSLGGIISVTISQNTQTNLYVSLS